MKKINLDIASLFFADQCEMTCQIPFLQK